MEQHRPIRVLILAHSGEIADRWTQDLRNSEMQVHSSAAELPAGVRPDVIITDGACQQLPPAVPAESAKPEHVEGLPAMEVAFDQEFSFDAGCDDRPGLVAVGADTSLQADVDLPADVSPRELQLACRLLAEIVSLRRALLARASSERRMAREALIDALTELPNRRAWDQRLEVSLASASFGEQPLCLAILDLDHFKQVNDTSGHAVGDQVLRTSGRTFGQNLRHGDFVARLGGDEFGLLLPMPDRATAESVVDRVRRALPVGLVRAGLPTVTASAGVCFIDPQPGVALQLCRDAILAAADTALRRAKSQGRDRTVVAPMSGPREKA